MSSGRPAPQNSRAALFAAMAAQQRGDLQAAIASYQQILQREPCNADAWLHLGIAMHRTSNRDLAENAFLRSLALDPLAPAAEARAPTWDADASPALRPENQPRSTLAVIRGEKLETVSTRRGAGS